MTPPQTAGEILRARLDALPEKATYAQRKQAYSQDMSAAVALGLAQALRARGLREVLPAPHDARSPAGTERRMAGGIGAKKVDVTWATEECGLILSASVKTIDWRDARSGNFQKNLTNRRGDLLFEAVTLHRRFPYAVLLGFLFLDAEAASDATDGRLSTFTNAHQRLKLFTSRCDPAGREEQFELLYVVLVSATPEGSTFSCTLAGEPSRSVTLEEVCTDALKLVADRNPDFYGFENGLLRRR